MKKDFSKWLIGKPNWSEIAFQYNTGIAYQNKQDLIAVFWNSYIYFQSKFENYFKVHKQIPYNFFNDLIFEFRQNFPINGRVNGINYFDDLIEQLLEKYNIDAVEKDNLHPKIFEGNAFKLFEYLTSQFKDNPTDISFIYRSMFRDKYIHAKVKPFVVWINEMYKKDIDQLKTLDNIGYIAAKQTIYTNAKDLYKQNKI